MHALQPVDLAFFERAPFRVETAFDVACTPDRVTRSLADNDDWAAWAGPIRRAAWTSSPVAVAGCTRDVWLSGGVWLSEVFFCWEEGRRVAFYIAAASLPGLGRFAEDYRISPVGPGVVRVTWTVCFEPAVPLLGHAIKAALSLMTPGWLKTFKTLLENDSSV